MYSHLSFLPLYRLSLRGRAYQYKVLPYRLSLLPHVFTKGMETAFAPAKESGYSHSQISSTTGYSSSALSGFIACAQGTVLRHSAGRAFRSTEKKQALPAVELSLFLCVKLDSVTIMASLIAERGKFRLKSLNLFRQKTVVSLQQFQRLLGLMASPLMVTPFGSMRRSWAVTND